MALTPQERLYLEHAVEEIAAAQAAAEALRYSYAHRPETREGSDYDQAEWERWDALTVRFARLADLVTQRIFRAIDAVEFVGSGTSFVDRLGRAEKRGHVDSAYEWKEIREIRNQIVHEYANDELLELIADVVRHAPTLLDTVGRLASYQAALEARLLAEGTGEP